MHLTRVLKTGGVTIIDDVQLWPCRIVADFSMAKTSGEKLSERAVFAAYRVRVASSEALNRAGA